MKLVGDTPLKCVDKSMSLGLSIVLIPYTSVSRVRVRTIKLTDYSTTTCLKWNINHTLRIQHEKEMVYNIVWWLLV